METETSNGAHMEMEKEEVRCVVSGKVQGVAFRFFAAKHARHLALVGFVRNAPDFRVEVVAQGFSDKLEKFIGHLRKGPFGSHVSDVSIEWREPAEEYETFEIMY